MMLYRNFMILLFLQLKWIVFSQQIASCGEQPNQNCQLLQEAMLQAQKSPSKLIETTHTYVEKDVEGDDALYRQIQNDVEGDDPLYRQIQNDVEDDDEEDDNTQAQQIQNHNDDEENEEDRHECIAMLLDGSCADSTNVKSFDLKISRPELKLNHDVSSHTHSNERLNRKQTDQQIDQSLSQTVEKVPFSHTTEDRNDDRNDEIDTSDKDLISKKENHVPSNLHSNVATEENIDAQQNTTIERRHSSTGIEDVDLHDDRKDDPTEIFDATDDAKFLNSSEDPSTNSDTINATDHAKVLELSQDPSTNSDTIDATDHAKVLNPLKDPSTHSDTIDATDKTQDTSKDSKSNEAIHETKDLNLSDNGSTDSDTVDAAGASKTLSDDDSKTIGSTHQPNDLNPTDDDSDSIDATDVTANDSDSIDATDVTANDSDSIDAADDSTDDSSRDSETIGSTYELNDLNPSDDDSDTVDATDDSTDDSSRDSAIIDSTHGLTDDSTDDSSKDSATLDATYEPNDLNPSDDDSDTIEPTSSVTETEHVPSALENSDTEAHTNDITASVDTLPPESMGSSDVSIEFARTLDNSNENLNDRTSENTKEWSNHTPDNVIKQENIKQETVDALFDTLDTSSVREQTDTFLANEAEKPTDGNNSDQFSDHTSPTEDDGDLDVSTDSVSHKVGFTSNNFTAHDATMDTISNHVKEYGVGCVRDDSSFLLERSETSSTSSIDAERSGDTQIAADATKTEMSQEARTIPFVHNTAPENDFNTEQTKMPLNTEANTERNAEPNAEPNAEYKTNIEVNTVANTERNAEYKTKNDDDDLKSTGIHNQFDTPQFDESDVETLDRSNMVDTPQFDESDVDTPDGLNMDPQYDLSNDIDQTQHTSASNLAIDALPAIDDPAIDDTTIENTTMDHTTIEDTTMDHTTIDDTTIDDPSIEDSSIDDHGDSFAEKQTIDAFDTPKEDDTVSNSLPNIDRDIIHTDNDISMVADIDETSTEAIDDSIHHTYTSNSSPSSSSQSSDETKERQNNQLLSQASEQRGIHHSNQADRHVKMMHPSIDTSSTDETSKNTDVNISYSPIQVYWHTFLDWMVQICHWWYTMGLVVYQWTLEPIQQTMIRCWFSNIAGIQHYYKKAFGMLLWNFEFVQTIIFYIHRDIWAFVSLTGGFLALLCMSLLLYAIPTIVIEYFEHSLATVLGKSIWTSLTISMLVVGSYWTDHSFPYWFATGIVFSVLVLFLKL